MPETIALLHETDSLHYEHKRLSPSVSYTYETHTGLYDFDNSLVEIGASLSYTFSKHFSASAAYSWHNDKGAYMRGGSTLLRTNNKFSVGAQYSLNNLFIRLQINSLLPHHGWSESTLATEYLNQTTLDTGSCYNRYFTIRVNYTIDFGRKIKHGNDQTFEGSSRTSVM